MSLPVPVLPRIGKLIRLLGSPQEHEVLGAARGLERTLKGVGSDLNELAHELVRCAAAPQIESADDWCSKLRFCLERASYLPAREQNFLGSLAGWRGQPSPKQLEWLASIKVKLLEWGC